MTEWKPVKDFDGYEVSSDGQVRSLDRIDSAGRKLKGKTLSATPSSNGYLMVYPSKNGKNHAVTVHSLVAEAFHDGDGWVNHINGDKTDNRAENLEWGTPGDNTRHAWHTGLRSKSVPAEVRQEIEWLYSIGARICDLAKEYSMPWDTVSRIAKGKSYA